ncbi:cupredoxin domain-containing protein [Candidatus Kaiserbacteria bacterium]|nr:cupredoxin domain-containing protein [Candidatus Kaiserbacteria bacterium]
MKGIILSIIVAVTIIGGAFIMATRGSPSSADSAHNVSIEDGKQIIEISAKGGYFPKKSVAKAGMPTVLRVKTNGTFDCSSSLRIPSMNVSTFLPPSGTTEIDLGSPQVTTLQGTCGMGMYSFQVEFQS